MAGAPLVAVVGSANLDQTATLARLPQAGETVLATAYAEGPGGKGLNQALAAAATAPTALVVAVGDDAAAELLLAAARARSVDVSAVRVVPGPSGRALVAVDAAGENQIVVVPGANAALSPTAVRDALERLRPTVVLVQSEIPPGAEAAALAWAAEHGVRAVWNRSPVRATDRALLAVADPLVVNEGEAAALAEEAGAELATCCRSLVVTRGAGGATWSVGAESGHVPAPAPAQVVDTTGAGDTAAGVLAASLARGATLPDAVAAAVAAVSRAVGTARAER